MTTRSVCHRYSFPWLARGRARAAWSVLLIAALACNLPFVDTGTDEAISLEMEAHAIRLQPTEITYSITLINHAPNAVGTVELGVAVAEGGSVHEILSIPRGSEVAQTDRAVTWRLDLMSPESIVGAFSFRVALDGPAQPVQATVRWKNPSPGEKVSVIEAVEEAALSEAAASMSALPLTQMPGTGMVLFGQGRRSLIPFGGAPTQGGAPAPLLTEIPGTGIRYFVPQGDRGQVTLARLDSDPQPGIGQDLTWLATYQVTKEQPGSAIVVVPLRQPAPPFSVVRVFVDSGEGYIEQDVMGSVTQDGLHAVFAADGASAYALGVDSGHMQNGASGDFMFHDGALQNMDLTEGVAGAVAESLNDLAGLMTLADTVNALLIGQTGSSTSQYDAFYQTDTDGDGLTDTEEEALGTDPDYWDTDGDRLTDGYEEDYAGTNPLSADSDGDGRSDFDEELIDFTDPNDEDTDNDGLDDGVEDTLGTDPNKADSDGDDATDAEEIDAGTDPNDPDSTPSSTEGSFAPVPGCGEQTCFSTGGDELYGLGDSLLPDSMQDFLGMQDLAMASPEIPETSNAQQVQGPSGGPALDARDLRAVIGVIENGILMVIPGGQRVQVVFGQSAVGGSQPTQDASTGTPPPGPTVAVTPTNSPVFISPPTETFTPEAPQDNEGPAIKGVSAAPDPIYAGAPKGCTPTSSGVTAAISDPSGVASATVIFVGASAGSAPMTHSGGTNWQAKLGPFDAPGAVNYQIRAFDSLGNRSDTEFFTLTVNACIP